MLFTLTFKSFIIPDFYSFTRNMLEEYKFNMLEEIFLHCIAGVIHSITYGILLCPKMQNIRSRLLLKRHIAKTIYRKLSINNIFILHIYVSLLSLSLFVYSIACF
jgi:hypothetical protein